MVHQRCGNEPSPTPPGGFEGVGPPDELDHSDDLPVAHGIDLKETLVNLPCAPRHSASEVDDRQDLVPKLRDLLRINAVLFPWLNPLHEAGHDALRPAERAFCRRPFDFGIEESERGFPVLTVQRREEPADRALFMDRGSRRILRASSVRG